MTTFLVLALLLVYEVQVVLPVDRNGSSEQTTSSWLYQWRTVISAVAVVIMGWFLKRLTDVPTVKIQKNYTVVAGEKVKLKCSASAFPCIKSVSWKHILPEGETKQLDIDQQKYTSTKPNHIVINQTLKSDEGEYVCIVSNWFGKTQSKHTKLTVEGVKDTSQLSQPSQTRRPSTATNTIIKEKFAMTSNVNDEVATLHNIMVSRIDEEIFGEKLEVVKELFRGRPLNAADTYKIKNIPSLFNCLMDYKTIDYGNYQKFESRIRTIHPYVCSMVRSYAVEIKILQGNLDDQGPPTAKQPKTEDQSQQQSTGDLAAMNVTTANTSYTKKINPDLEPMIEDTYRLLAQKYKVTDDCIVPVKDASNQEELIIIYDPSCNTERRLKEFGHDVIIRNQKYVSTEGAIVSSICKTEQYSIRPEDRNNLKQTLNHHMKRLFASHSNLNIITTSPVKSKNKGDDIIEGPCIVLVCSSKGYIPNGESKFPKELIFEKTTYMVDVREGYFQFSPYSTNSSSHFHQNIKMGCSFGIEGTTNAGTVGPFVDSQGHQLFLTCAHIVNGVDPKGYYLKNIQNMFAEQPDAMTFCESSQRCGEVRRAVFLPDNNPSSVDAAVVQITEQSRIPSRGEFAIDSKLNFKAAGFDDLPRFESGEIHDDPDTLDIDLRIVKFGAKTHATRGVISSHGTAARPLTTNLGLLGQPNMCVMKNQIEVFSLEGHSHFFSPGDSGSGVFVVNKLSTGEQKLTCIGLAIGCTSYGSAVVTPIAAVLDALGLPRRLKQFP